MFTETMTGSELLREYYSDLSETRSKTSRLNGSEYIARHLRKNRKSLRTSVSKVFSTARNNRYLVLLVYSRESPREDWSMSSYNIGLIGTERGMCAVAFFLETRQAMILTPHFFKRYRERFLTVCDWKTRARLERASGLQDIAQIYMERNLTITWAETEGSDFGSVSHIFGLVNDGVALIQWERRRKLLQANTFLTFDMLNRKQSLLAEYSRLFSELDRETRSLFDSPVFLKEKGDGG